MIKNKLDFSFFIATIFVFSLIVSTVVVTAQSKDDYISIEIEQGDSLWEIAESFNEHHSMSSAQFVKWVADKNGINKNNIYPGQEMIIPVKEELYIAFQEKME